MVILVNFWGMSWSAWEWETIKDSVLGAGMGTLSWVLPSEIPPNSQGKEPMKIFSCFWKWEGGRNNFEIHPKSSTYQRLALPGKQLYQNVIYLGEEKSVHLKWKGWDLIIVRFKDYKMLSLLHKLPLHQRGSRIITVD